MVTTVFLHVMVIYGRMCFYAIKNINNNVFKERTDKWIDIGHINRYLQEGRNDERESK